MNKKDGILICSILLIACLLYLVYKPDTAADTVEITVNGECFGTYYLQENQIVHVENTNGINIVEIKDGKVHILEADCKDHYCMKQGYLPGTRTSLICLPHRLVVKVKRKSEDMGLDAVSG